MKNLTIILLLCVLSVQAQFSLRDPAFLASSSAPAGTTWAIPTAGYTLWLTPQDPSTMFTNGIGTVAATASGGINSRVGKWVDKSSWGTNHVYQVGNLGSDDTRPMLTNTAAFNNQPVLNFRVNGLIKSALMTSNNITLGLSNSGSYTFFIVGQMNSARGGDNYNCAFSINNSATDFIGFRKNNTTYQAGAFDGVGAANGPIISTNNAMVYGARFSNSLNTLQLWTNTFVAATLTSDTASPPGPNKFIVGAYTISLIANFWDGFIGDIVFYPFTLTDQEMTNNLTALKAKYIP